MDKGKDDSILLNQFKADLLNRKAHDSAPDNDDSSVLDDFFTSRAESFNVGQEVLGNHSQSLSSLASRHIPRQPDGLESNRRISGESGSFYQPHYSRHKSHDPAMTNNVLDTTAVSLKRLDPKEFSHRFKASIVPSHLKKTSKAVDKSKSRYGMQNYLHSGYSSQNKDVEQSDSQRGEHAYFEYDSKTNQNIKDEFDVLKKKLEEAEAMISHKDSEISILRNDLKQARNEIKVIDHTEEHEIKLDEMNDALLEARAKNMTLQKQVIKLTTERQKALQNLSEIELINQKLLEENSKRKQIITSLKEKNLLLQNKQQIVSNPEESLRKEANLQAEIEDLKSKNDALHVSISQLIDHL